MLDNNIACYMLKIMNYETRLDYGGRFIPH